ncbi:hypothetical protein G7Y41_03840 [Schaalia sp. ZJ405]|uniref:hypothetical protein n=1 Tax=Schaalia sp. ZJ405 TaxID=2709403 RepID=UPI0013EBB8C8|nr:hypothetical protein [Schaalia sp. ZJ405]QPK81954.1 hypothetical protein G7Y41_03840 [Schaalia sp. ZJ405]
MTGTGLSALGFHDDWEETTRVIEESEHKEILPFGPYRHVSVCEDESGACIGFIETTDGMSTGVFTVHGQGGLNVKAWQIWPGIAELSICDEDGALVTKVAAFVDDPFLYPQYDPKAVGELAIFTDYQLGAIGLDVKIFDCENDWVRSQEASGETDVLLGPSFVASPWLFALADGTASPQDVSPLAMFCAICENVEVVTNSLTGKQWYKISANCAVPCTLALPIDSQPAPRPGSIVSGKAFITGSSGIWREYEYSYGTPASSSSTDTESEEKSEEQEN